MESRRLRLFSVCHTAATAASRPAITLTATSAVQLSWPGRNLPSPPSLWEHMCLCLSLRPKSSLFLSFSLCFQFFSQSWMFSLSPSLPPSLLPSSHPPVCVIRVLQYGSLLVCIQILILFCIFLCCQDRLRWEQKTCHSATSHSGRGNSDTAEQQLGKNGRAEGEEQWEKEEVEL